MILVKENSIFGPLYQRKIQKKIVHNFDHLVTYQYQQGRIKMEWRKGQIIIQCITLAFTDKTSKNLWERLFEVYIPIH